MKAISVKPLQKDSHQLVEVDTLKINENELLVKVLQAGVCRTDLEIIEGLYGEAPQGEDRLIIGHESVGEVLVKGKDVSSLNVGDLVVRAVRRPCLQNCLNCRNGQNDMCRTGDYTEIGIKGIHGIMSEYYKDEENYLIRIPEQYRDIAVLLEPLSFVEKVIDQTLKAQQRMHWELGSSLVLGSGPIGILAAMVLRSMGLKTDVISRSKSGFIKSELIEESGARYFSNLEHSEEDLAKKIGKVDLVIEATGNSSLILQGLKYLRTNGVLALTSITGDYNPKEVDLSKFNLDLVLNNNLILGVVNANKQDYVRGVERFEEFEDYWPGLAKKLITKTVPLEDYTSALSKGSYDIKNVIDFR